MRVANDVLNVLDAARKEGQSLVLVGQLDRALYERTNKVLEAAGGKWNRKAKAHIFDGPAEDAMEQIILTGEVTIPQDFGYFPTPEPIVERLIELADLKLEHKVLEPSAGRGNIAHAVEPLVKEVFKVELLPENSAHLKEPFITADFLTVFPVPMYDRVVMNPPFAKQDDIRHVLHALKFLKPDGLLVSVMSAGVTFRDNKLTTEFRDLIRERGGDIEALEEGAFKRSGTLVNTVIVTIPA